MCWSRLVRLGLREEDALVHHGVDLEGHHQRAVARVAWKARVRVKMGKVSLDRIRVLPRLEILMLVLPPEFPTGLRAWVLRLSSDACDTRRSLFIGGGEHEASSSCGAAILSAIAAPTSADAETETASSATSRWLSCGPRRRWPWWFTPTAAFSLLSFSPLAAAAASAALACCSAIARPTSTGGAPPGPPGPRGPPPEAAAACWLYILKRARRVISKAERGFPVGLPTPPGIGGLLGGFPRRPSESGGRGGNVTSSDLGLLHSFFRQAKGRAGGRVSPLIEADG